MAWLWARPNPALRSLQIRRTHANSALTISAEPSDEALSTTVTSISRCARSWLSALRQRRRRTAVRYETMAMDRSVMLLFPTRENAKAWDGTQPAGLDFALSTFV